LTDKRHCDGPGCDEEFPLGLHGDTRHRDWITLPAREPQTFGANFWHVDRHFCSEEHLSSCLADQAAKKREDKPR
jgi:hypothetical protein